MRFGVQPRLGAVVPACAGVAGAVSLKKGATILAKEAVKSKSVQLREIAHDYLYQVLLQWGKSYLTPEADVIQGMAAALPRWQWDSGRGRQVLAIAGNWN